MRVSIFSFTFLQLVVMSLAYLNLDCWFKQIPKSNQKVVGEWMLQDSDMCKGRLYVGEGMVCLKLCLLENRMILSSKPIPSMSDLYKHPDGLYHSNPDAFNKAFEERLIGYNHTVSLWHAAESTLGYHIGKFQAEEDLQKDSYVQAEFKRMYTQLEPCNKLGFVTPKKEVTSSDDCGTFSPEHRAKFVKLLKCIEKALKCEKNGGKRYGKPKP